MLRLLAQNSQVNRLMSHKPNLRDFRDQNHLFKRHESDLLEATGLTGNVAEKRERLKKLRRLQEPIAKDLLAQGIIIESVWDLIRHIGEYDDALPVLLKHLERDYYSDARDALARAFCTPAAYPYFDSLAELYRKTSKKDPKDWALGGLSIALTACSKDKRLSEIMELAGLGITAGRPIFIAHLKRYWRRPDVWEWLNKNLDEPSLAATLAPWIQKKRMQIDKAVVSSRK